MVEKTRGVFLHAVKYSETSLIATIYTEIYGRQTFIINGTHAKHSSLKASAFQALYLLELELYYKAGRDIQRLKTARIIHPFTTIQFDIRKSSQAFFIAEMLYKCLREEVPNETLFQFIVHSLTFLDLSDSAISNFHLWFLFKLTRFLGINPSPDNSVISNFFDLQRAIFVTHEPLHNQYADKHSTSLLSRLFDAELTSPGNLEYTSAERKIVLEKLLEFYRIHFDNLGEIKSLVVLKEVFS